MYETHQQQAGITEMVQNSPQLWTRISADIKAEGFKKVLQRSSGHRIDITCEISPLGLGQNPEEHLEDFLSTLGAITDRWRTLDLKCLGDAHEHSVKDALRLPASNLERLVLDDEIMELDISDIELLGGECPNLKDIRVAGVQCRWSQVAFKGLENLHLSWVTFSSVGPVLDILRDCPQLRKLEICECTFVNNVPSTTQPVSLHGLQILHLDIDEDVGPTSAIDELLNFISAPLHCALYNKIFAVNEEEYCRKIRFEKWLFGRQPQSVLEGLDGFELHLGGSQLSGCFMEFTLSSGCSVITGGFRAWDTCEAVHAMGFIETMRQRLCVTGIFTTLKISSSGVSYFGSRDFVSQLNRLPPISRLELIDFSSPAESDVIADVFLGSDAEAAPHFATIKHLSFRETHLDIVSGIVQAALRKPETETDSKSKDQMDHLYHLEIRVKEPEFARAEQVVEALRKNPRIGEVDLYVVL
ncbi:hypothetical protein FS837_002230 [Tulasnella sp. UAMH 9824]|nr:hypothetical protein FS837_002230 [Tulasnella sp. UAMH 9824]